MIKARRLRPRALAGAPQHIDESADEALGDHSDPTMTDDAVDFLKEMLAKGPLGVAAIELEARGRGCWARTSA